MGARPTRPPPCEICGQSQWEILLTNEGPSVCSGRELVRADVPLVKGACAGCGFVQTLQSPLDGSIDRYHRDVFSSKLHSDNYDYVNYARGKAFGAAVNDFVLAHDFAPRGRLLDIGCGKGLFEQAFLARYPEWSVEGVDPSQRSIEIARRLAPQATFSCRSFQGADYATDSYDLVAMHMVLNRVPPRDFVRDAVGLMANGGILSVAIAVLPEAPFQLYFADDYYLFFPEHLFALMEEYGLEVVAHDEVGSIWRYLLRKTDRKAGRWRTVLTRVGDQFRSHARMMIGMWRELLEEIEQLKRDGQHVAFYGAGTTLMIILSQTDFPRALIAGIFDDNDHKHGETMWGLRVQPPGDALERADAIVLCAGPSGVRTMRDRLNLPGKRTIGFGLVQPAAVVS